MSECKFGSIFLVDVAFDVGSESKSSEKKEKNKNIAMELNFERAKYSIRIV